MNKILIFVALMITLVMPSGVVAQEATESGSEDDVEMSRPDGFIPDPDSRLFGLQMAWMRLSENFERFTANTEEKKAELELKYLEKEAWLIEMIAKLEERDPELAAKFQERLDGLDEAYQARLARLDDRIERNQGRLEEMGERRDAWTERLRERRDLLQERREVRRERREQGLEEGEGDLPQRLPAESPAVQVIQDVPLRDGRGN